MPLTKEKQGSLTPQDAMSLLIKGHESYHQQGSFELPSAREEAAQLSKIDGQFPIATAIFCSDSRVDARSFFRLKDGEIFTIQNAGNAIDQATLASAEYGVCNLNTPLIIIIGHTNCGAVAGAASGEKFPGALGSHLQKLNPAVMAENLLSETVTEDLTEIAANQLGIDSKSVNIPAKFDHSSASEFNVGNSIRSIIEQSELIYEALKEGKCGICSAMFDLENRKLEFGKILTTKEVTEIKQQEKSPSSATKAPQAKRLKLTKEHGASHAK